MATLTRVLRTSKATLSKVIYLDETATAASGSVTVTITRLDGTTVESGTATGPSASNVYTWTFGGRDILDELIVTWSGTFGGDAVVLDQDRIEVVGGFFFGIAEARAIDSTFSNTTKWPESALIEARTQTESEAELICGQAFVPRYAREVLSGRWRTTMPLSNTMIRNVRSVTVAGSAFSGTQVANIGFDDAGAISVSSLWPPSQEWRGGARNIVIEYEHGWDRPPVDIVRAAKRRFASILLQNNNPLPDRTERVTTTELGTVTLASPSYDKTGIPEVDAAYGRYPCPRPGFG
jgi:hypothetical protein